MRLSLSEIVPADPALRMTRALAAAAARDLWKPVFCTCAIGFVWQLVAGLFSVSADASSAAGFGGLALASAVVLLIELFSERGFEALRVYQVLFPLVTGVFMLPSLLGVQFAPLVVGMLLFGFEILNLLLIVTCAVYSSERGVPAAQTYALCVGPTLVAMFAGDAMGKRLGPIVAYDFALGVNVLFLCVYALSMVLFLVSFRRRRRQAGTDEAGEEGRIDVAVVGGSHPLAAPERVCADAVSSPVSHPVRTRGATPGLARRALRRARAGRSVQQAGARGGGARPARQQRARRRAQALHLREHGARPHEEHLPQSRRPLRQELIDLLD